ncbi:MAG: transglycosylase domain-containing protein, partial [Alistipes sp.]|nr:transglycosylase domain-containing protein [Alistipes sp.]
MAVGAILLLWLFCLPRDLFEGVPYSTVVTDRNGELLGARVADDGQWRFPLCDTLPEKFAKALVEFEDRTFYRHPGVSLRALVRAAVQNLRNGHVVSGGSTLSMQVIRLSRRKPRTLWQKIVEIFMATRLEMRYSKADILRLYASHAPFGGNVVGIDAALWRYLGDGEAELSWAEAAALAVLQNAPSSIHLAKNRDKLLDKRNRLLVRLRDKGDIPESDYLMAIEEPLIGTPCPMPQHAPHLVEWYDRTAHGRQVTTHIDFVLQRRVEDLTTRWSKDLRLSGIRDLAVVIVEVESGEIMAYCGNSDMNFERNGKWVDIARAPRSSGSILKPLLYAAALQEGTILPHALLPDVPTDFGGFAPKNFDGTYAGAIAADEAR